MRHRLHAVSRPLRSAHIERLPWLLVGALLAALVTMVERAAGGLRPMQALIAMVVQLFAF